VWDQKRLPPEYEREMDVDDITHGRTRPRYEFVDALGPVRLPPATG
jgi:hypothetical protein